jgi:HSP20 family protein
LVRDVLAASAAHRAASIKETTMANLTWWRRPSSLTLRRDMEDILDEFDVPGGLRREMARLLEDDLSPRTMMNEMDRLFEDFVSPPPLRRRMARLFEPLLGRGGMSGMSGGGRREEMFAPQIEMMERDDNYIVRADLPGVREQDVNVRVDDNNILTITGERRKEETKRERGYEYTERSYGSFTRSIELPRGAETQKIEADFRNGVLEIHVPKGEAARARQIPVRAQGREGREREMGGSREEPRVLEPGDGGRKEKGQNQNANATR